MLKLNEEQLKVAKRLRPLSDYAREVLDDFKQIEPYLPERVDSIIDIGCGLAAIDVYLKDRYPSAHLTLVDSDGESGVYGYGFASTHGAYGSRAMADALLAENGITADRWLPACTKEVLEADLVVSLLAWGFHFPLETYRVNGYCIADLRNNFEPQRGTVIADNGKTSRCAFRMTT